MSSESEDLMLLERAFLRIGSTESDSQFEAVIDKLLGPIIFKIPSNNESVRKKAIELLTHISKRIKCRPEVKVPVETLLKLYDEVSQDQFVKNFLVVYIKLGYHRMSSQKQIENIPMLLKCIANPKTSDQLKDSLLCLMIKSCKYFVNEEVTKQFLSTFTLSECNVLNIMLEMFADVLLLPYYSVSDQPQRQVLIPPCMSCYSYKRLTQDGKIEDLHLIKLGILQLLSSSNLSNEVLYLDYIIASVDLRDEVSHIGRQHLKKIEGAFEWTDDILRPVYKLFVGDSDKVVEEKRKRPADLRLKLKLLPYLQRIDCYCWPECIQVVVLCIQEEGNASIKLSGLSFGLAALQKTELHSFKEVAPNFLHTLTEMLWNREKDTATRNMIYKLAGNVISLNPELVKYHKEIFPKFIEDLTEESSPEMRITIKDSLMKMASAFKETEEPDSLMHFLANRITSPEPLVKHIVMHYLHKVFPFDHVKSRFLLVYLSADSNSKIREEAENLLFDHFKTIKENKSEKSTTKLMPDLAEIIRYFRDGCISNKKLNPTFAFGDQNLVMTPFTYAKIISYVRICLLYECYWPLCIMKYEHPCSYSPKIGKFFRNLDLKDKKTLLGYAELVIVIGRDAQHIEPIKIMKECLGTAADVFTRPFMFYEASKFLRKIMDTAEEEIGIAAAETLGLHISYSISMTDNWQQFKENAEKLAPPINEKQAIRALFFFAILAQTKSFAKFNGLPVPIVEAVVQLCRSNDASVAYAALHCLGRIAGVYDLPIPNRNLKDPVKYGDFDGINVDEIEKSSESKKELSEEHTTTSITKLKLVEKLLDLIIEKDVIYKVKMKATEALGLMCVGEEDFIYRKLIIHVILEKQNDIKIAGTLLDLGELLTDCIMGPYSVKSLNLWLQKESDMKLPKDWNHIKCKELFFFTARKIRSDIIENINRKSKTSAAIWLLILMKKCSKLPLQLNDLAEIQSLFLDLIALNDETIHDAATRGLSFIPRYANEESTNTLAKQLIDKICNINKAASEIGNVLGMYKEFCYLVLSLKHPGIIYHFLNLLNHDNQNSDDKYASTFKDDEEASKCELMPYLSQIVTSLYFYRFHPSPKIKQAMSAIWKTLFPENVKTVQAHSKSILQNAVPDLTRPNFELRIAYCHALEDLLRIEGNKFLSDNKSLMPDLLTNLYRLMDDIYDSVKRTAYGTTKMYLTAFVQNIMHSKKAEIQDNELLNLVLPVLLTKGVSSNVSEVKNVSVKALQDIVDHVGPLIKSHLHYLIPTILENAAHVDVAVNSALSEFQQADLVDAVREKIVALHFSVDTLKGCMNYIDEDVLEKLLPRLLELLKDNVSYSARTAAITFVSNLSISMDSQKLQPFVGKLLGALLPALSSNQKTIRKNAATAIGGLSKVAKESSIDNLLNKLVAIFSKNSNDENIRMAVGQTIFAIGSQNQEAVQKRAEKIVPIIFFAMHLKKLPDGSNDEFLTLWNDVWNDVVGSMEVALTKYKVSVISFIADSFKSPSWSAKSQATRSLTTFVNKYPENLKDCEELKIIVKDIIATLQARFWHGKEDILETAAALCSKNSVLESDLQIEIIETLLKECERGNIAYKTIALESMGKILMSTDRDYFTQIYDKIKTIIADNFEENATINLDKEESASVANQCVKLKETAYLVLGKAWPNSVETQNSFQEEVVQLLTECLVKNTRITQVSVMVALKNVISKLHILKKQTLTAEEKVVLNNLMTNIEKAILYAIELKKHALLKKEALHVMINLMELFKESSNEICLKRIIDVFTDHVNDLSKDSDPIIALQTSQLKDFLKRVNK